MNRGFGFLALHGRALHAQPQVAARIADLLVDRRWPWSMGLVRPTPMPNMPVYPWPSGKVPHARIQGTVVDILRSNSSLGIHLAASRKDELNHVFAHIDAGHAEYTGHADGTDFPFEARLFCRDSCALPLPDGTAPISGRLKIMMSLTPAPGMKRTLMSGTIEVAA